MKSIIFFAFIMIFLSCNKNETNAPKSELFTVSGNVVYQNQPVTNAKVSIQNVTSSPISTDADGYFKILNVPKGNHRLVVEKETGQSYVRLNKDIAVDQNMVLSSLVLPDPPYLYDIREITEDSLKIVWRSTIDPDFREYKLYRHTSSGLDETTGTLIHVATSMTDTIFWDKTFQSSTTYYYRVYVMDDFGKLGGSNIVSVTTLPKNVVENGDFEIIQNQWPVNWDVWGSPTKFSIDSSGAYSGNYSFKTRLEITDQGVYSWGIKHVIPASRAEAGEQYKLSFYYKHNEMEENYRFEFWFKINNSGPSVFEENIVLGPQIPADWTYFEREFTMPSPSLENAYYLNFTFVKPNQNIPAEYWIDDVKLEKLLP